MAGQGGTNHLHEQPGLEVNYQPGLEVDTRYSSPRPESEGLQHVTYQQEKAYTNTAALPQYAAVDQSAAAGAHTAALSNYDGGPEVVPAKEGAGAGAATAPKRKLTWIIVGAIIAVVVIVAAVVGGVLGSRAAKSSSSADSTTSGSNSTNAADLENIRSLSRLAVTGWRDGGVARIRIFYQGPDQKLRTSWYANNESSWSDPIVLTELEYEASANTSLAAACSLEFDPVQYKMLYTDENLILRGHGFKEVGGDGDEKGQGTRLELNSWPVAVPSGSRLASYWPFIMFQNDDDNSFQWVRYWGSSADDYFSNRTLDVRGSVDSGMVVLPSSAWYLNNGGMVYRRSDGKMKTYESYSGNNVTDKAWGEDDLSQTIPSNTAIGGFAIARDNVSNNYTNTYVLYQDDDDVIQMVWQDDNTSWKGPQTWDAFNGADAGTDITCVTAAAWDAKDVEITSNDNLSRCYFQVSNQVREVSYDGSDWTDLGYLPIT